MSWDLFISHAREDKAAVACPLVDMLQARGLKVWYDEYTLTVTEAPKPVLPRLSAGVAELATKLMRHAVAGNGQLLAAAYLGRFTVQAGAHSDEAGEDRRKEARLKAVVRELATVGRIEPLSEDVYQVTHLGYLWTDALATSLPA